MKFVQTLKAINYDPTVKKDYSDITQMKINYSYEAHFPIIEIINKEK